MNEEVKTEEKQDTGRPAISKEQFDLWLEDMRPHLVLGCSLYRGMEKAGLLAHKTAIYEKYRLNDYFAEKVDAWRATPGENVNEAFVRSVEAILTKVKQDKILTTDEVKIMTTFAEKHRTAQPFFVSRTETAEAKDKDLGKILDILESDYGEFGQESDTGEASAQATKQEVANDAPVQGEEQSGPTGNVSTEPHTA